MASVPGSKKRRVKVATVEGSIVKKIADIKAKRASISKVSDANNKKPKKGKTNEEKALNSTAQVNTNDQTLNLMLKDVLDLGGTQEDFDILKGLSDGEDEVVEINENTGSDNFNVGELVTFMKSNGLKVPKKEKKQAVVKEAKAPPVIDAPTLCPFAPSDPPQHDKLIFKANEPWYTTIETHKSSLIFEGIEKWKHYAQKLWDNEIELSTKLRDKFQSTDQQWMQTVLTGGTMNDKISAHCLLLQESPIHHIRSLEAMINMAKKKSKRLAIIAVDTLKEMFIGTLLPDDRKLLSFHQHDFAVLKGPNTNKLALGWLVEDKLKALYGEFIEIIRAHLGDNEVPIRTKLCNLSFQLLNEKPEKEQEILSLIVNKIGDPDKKLASKIIYILGQLLQNHPSMKTVVTSEIERVLFRPNISERAQYYAICFLNQLQLSFDESSFAAHLTKIYFKFFEESIANQKFDSRMLGGLLTGVNRSYPYVAEADGITDENTDTLFKLVYISNFNVAVQALMLLYQVSGRKENISNRYYQALYSKLLDSSINSSSKKTFLLNLIYKSLKRDTAVSRKVALARRLLQVSNLDDPILACASLYTISAANKESAKDVEELSKSKTPSTSDDEKVESTKPKTDTYDCAIRNPLYSNADRQNLWEFILLCRSYHPSVNEFVSSLLSEGEISYSGDPFNDFTRTKFLDKFVFKNPKTGVQATNRKFYSKNKIESSQPQVYSSAFREQKSSKIQADELFFYNYFQTKKAESSAKEDPPTGDEPGDADDALDFADDIKGNVLTKSEKKQKKKREEEEESDVDDDEDGDSDFSYEDMQDEDVGDETEARGDKAYEKFLWENLDSDGESIKDSQGDENEDAWEDIDVDDDSDDGEQQKKGFVDADALDQIILQHKSQTKEKKRKAVSDDQEEQPPKKKKGKKSLKSDKSKGKKSKPKKKKGKD